MRALIVILAQLALAGRALCLLPPPVLESDSATRGLFEFSQQAVSTGDLRDLSGRSASGKLSGRWEFIAAEELRPRYSGAGRILPDGKGQAVLTGLAATPGQPFSVDVLLRWERNGGMVLRIGDPEAGLLMGVLHRGPGEFELRVPVRTSAGTPKMETLSSTELYQAPHVEPVRLDEFDLYSLVYDGGKTFTVFINGWRAFEGSLKDGEPAWTGNDVAVGDVGSWKSAFKGDIAAVRLSQGIRSYTGATATPSRFSAGDKRGWVFDAGPESSPLRDGAIPLTEAEIYSPDRGFGWIQPPKDSFDSWYSPSRYEADPKQALAKKTYKIHDFLARDGVVLNGGDFFRLDVPDGEYWVVIGLGNSLGKTELSEVAANGSILGADLRMDGNIFGGNVPHRTVRGLVRAKGGEGIIFSADLRKGAGVPVQSIEVLPHAPLPVGRKDGRIEWLAEGPAPQALKAVNEALAQGDLAGATAAAESIPDAFVQAAVLALILGEPKLPDEADLHLAEKIRQLLLAVRREEPENAGARWLFDSTERFRHALIGYLGSYNGRGGNEVVYGTRFQLWLATANQGLQLKPEDPQFWQAKFLSGAGIFQYGNQGSAFPLDGSTDSYVEGREIGAFPPPGPLFREISSAFPDFRIARIMLGERLPVGEDWHAPANAPEWAVLQYQLSRRILEVAHFWINERMDENGLMGGGLGDDVELLRWWWPGILLADDQTVMAGWRRMASAAWKSTGGAGYSRTMDDVEHSSENTSDPFPPLALINHDTDQMAQTEHWLTRTQPAFRDIWTTVTPEGYRMFKGHFLNATEIAREGDVPLNVRAIKPLLWAAWASNGKNPELRDLLVAYAASWRDATLRSFDGKPAGIIPPNIMLDRKTAREPTGKDWANPGYKHVDYPNHAGKVYDLLFAAYELTDDRTFLDPVRHALNALAKIPAHDLDPAKYPPSSYDWALRRGTEFIGVAGATYRALTEDKSYDALLERIGPPLTRYQIAPSPANLQPLLDDLRHALGRMNSNPEERTTMVQSTDRIFVPGSITVSSMATGAVNWTDPRGRGGELVWPTFQVTWRGTKGELAALVEKATPSELTILLYNFSLEPLALRPRVWRLETGLYRMTLSPIGDGTSSEALSTRDVQIESSGQEIPFDLPSRTPLRLNLVRK